MANEDVMSKQKGGSPPVTPEMAAKIRALRKQGFMQHTIAAHFGINQGRVSEVENGQRHPTVPPDDSQLPLF
jgi:transcriptional regulator with XRE-family HTH domain